MKKDLGTMPAVCPMPVLIIAAYDTEGKVNAMNAAWGMTCATDEIALFIDEDHKTTQNILATKAFTVSLADKDHMVAADYLGIASGNKVPDKFARSKLHAVKSDKVNAPVIEEFPVVMECELAEVVKTGTIYAIVGKVVNVKADEKVLDDKGKIDISKTGILMFDQYTWSYNALGEKVGKAGSAGKELMH